MKKYHLILICALLLGLVSAMMVAFIALKPNESASPVTEKLADAFVIAEKPMQTPKNTKGARQLFVAGIQEGKSFEESIAFFDACIERHHKDADPNNRLWAAKSMRHKSRATYFQRQGNPPITLLNACFERFRNDPDPNIRKEAIEALFSMAPLYVFSHKRDDAIATLDKCVEYFQDDPSPLVRDVVCEIFFYKASRFTERELGEAVKTYNILVERYRDDPAPEIQAWVARAIMYKAKIYEKQGDYWADHKKLEEKQGRKIDYIVVP